MGTLSTSKIYRCQGQLYAFLPHFMDREEFYLVSDNDYLVSLFEQEVAAVRNNWMQIGRPTMVVMLTNQMLSSIDQIDNASHAEHASKKNLLNFLIAIKSTGICNGVRVRVGRLSEMINTACIESLDFLVNHGSDSSEDWDQILKGHEEKVEKDILKGSNDNREKVKIGGSIRRRTTMLSGTENLPAKSPLTKSLGYDHAIEDLILEDSATSNFQESPEGEYHVIPLAVTLGNPEKTEEAIELLQSCISLYDQVELLHYLYSCHGGNFNVPKLATVNELLEEIYWKAMHSKLWSVVRTAAGILRKNVNSLTGNLSDLLIRQKPVTVGIRPNEYFIDTPKNPDTLSKIIYEHR
jgi:phosphorylase kinase alpha/beta subunit